MADGSTEVDEFAVGDPVRALVGSAVFRLIAVAVAVFGYLWLGKEIPGPYAREPWREDPYDAVVSFMLDAVPLLIGVLLVRLRLCRRDATLPARRVVDLLRLCRVLVGVLGATAVTEWIAVATVGDRNGPGRVFGLFLVLLTAVTAAIVWVGHRVRAANRGLRGLAVPPQPDWFADLVAFGERESQRLPLTRAAVREAVRWFDRVVIGRVRRHPMTAAAAFAVCFASLTGSAQIVLEGYRPPLAAWFLTVSASSTFAFVVLIGRYLPLVELRPRPAPAGYVALVAAAAAVPVAAGFRSALYWSLGANDATADLGQLTLVTLLWPAAVGAAAYATAAARSRHLPARPDRGGPT